MVYGKTQSHKVFCKNMHVDLVDDCHCFTALKQFLNWMGRIREIMWPSLSLVFTENNNIDMSDQRKPVYGRLCKKREGLVFFNQRLVQKVKFNWKISLTSAFLNFMQLAPTEDKNITRNLQFSNFLHSKSIRFCIQHIGETKLLLRCPLRSITYRRKPEMNLKAVILKIYFFVDVLPNVQFSHLQDLLAHDKGHQANIDFFVFSFQKKQVLLQER